MKTFLAIFISLAYSFCSAQLANTDIAMTEARYVPLEKTIFYKLGDRTLPINIIQYGPGNDIVCVNIHDNEFTSVQAAQAVLQTRGGTLIRIDNKGERLIRFQFQGRQYAIDPNRIFSRVGIEEAFKDEPSYNYEVIDELEKLGRRLLSLIPDSTRCVIALHNNTDEAWSIKSYVNGGERQTDAREVYLNEKQDADDLVLTTDVRLFREMSKAGYNCILQHNKKAKKDGSLSIYFGELNRQYVNIETQHGRVSQYQEMLEKLLGILVSE